MRLFVLVSDLRSVSLWYTVTHAVIRPNVHLSAAGSAELRCYGLDGTVSDMCLSERIPP